MSWLAEFFGELLVEKRIQPGILGRRGRNGRCLRSEPRRDGERECGGAAEREDAHVDPPQAMVPPPSTVTVVPVT